MRLAALLVAATLGASSGAFAVERAGQRVLLLRQGSVVDLHVLESRQRRREFQERQQRYREQDRQATGRLRQRLEVPVLRRNCQVPPYGNNFLPSCR
jgi:hypothetical protein